ncbi:MAG: single-stranded DNA-binding protein [Aristaeellaceae bacterium]
MNKLTIIGNLTRDPELRNVNTADGTVSVCDFTVAVNRRNGGNNDVDYFRVTAWRGLGENCKKYLAKGRKVAVVGPVRCRTYQANDGGNRASLEVKAEEVEFLTSRSENGQQPYQNSSSGNQSAPPAYQNAAPQSSEQQRMDTTSGYTIVADEDIPF